MIVVDASAMLEALLQTSRARSVESILFNQSETIHAPHLIDLEVAQVVRRWTARGFVDAERGGVVLTDLAAFPLRRHAHTILLPRIWELRDNITAYDAVYVALAEALQATLLTGDHRLAAAAARHARIALV